MRLIYETRESGHEPNRLKLSGILTLARLKSDGQISLAINPYFFEEHEKDAADKALSDVLKRFEDGVGRGVSIEEVAGGIRLITRPELHGYLQKFFDITGRSKLSMAALETLAIVAYREPITGPELQELRGVNSGGVLRTLLERRLVRIAGRKAVVGRPFIYRTTREFLPTR